MEIKRQVDATKDSGKQALESGLIDSYLPVRCTQTGHQRYQTILTAALETYSSQGDIRDKPKRGKKRQSKDKNLLDCLIKYEMETLRFMEDFQVPFDNNLAKRDLRMLKVKQPVCVQRTGRKVSGCFRSENGANYFCRIRGFISTAKKQGKKISEYLFKSFQPSEVGPILLSEG